MATKYNDIIKLRGGKAAYSITDEKSGEWDSFIPNKQFNEVLRTILKSVRGNDIDNHKSFWIEGTYGTGKSHAAAVISHLLCDDVKTVSRWVEYEYKEEKYAQLRGAFYSLRNEKRLLAVKLKGLHAMSHSSDLVPVLQKAVVDTLNANNISIHVRTDYQTYIDHIKNNPGFWDHLIKSNTSLSGIVSSRDDLIHNLEDVDIDTFHTIGEVLRQSSLDVRMDISNMVQWLVDVQAKLREMGTYHGLLIVWDEFTDVMADAIGLSVLKELQNIAELFMNTENDSFLLLVSHPSAFDKMSQEQSKQTDGRYHRMKYNMESVSAFRIMSRKLEVVDSERHNTMCRQFYADHEELLDLFVLASNDPQSTRKDLKNLYPMHPGTANLATHYATVVGSSSRSVFEFLGQNEAIRDFLDNEEHFSNHDTITADYLWDYVLKVFQGDVQNYSAVTERYNSYVSNVEARGAAYSAIFKGVLLLNAFNNLSGEHNNGLITPSEENVQRLFEGTRYADQVDEVLEWFNSDGVIQRSPLGLFSVQFSALPSGEIENKKSVMRNVEFCVTSKIIDFATEEAARIVEKKMMPKVIRPYQYRFYSDTTNESSLRSQIKNGRKATKSSHLFFAILVSRDNNELAALRIFAEKCAKDDDKDLKNIVFIVMDAVFGTLEYDRFIEYQANYSCASSHGFIDQTASYRDNAIQMVKEWLETMLRSNATFYINGHENQPFSMNKLSKMVNENVSPILFPYGPDAHDLLRQKAPATFWKMQNSKEMVRTMLFANTMTDIQEVTAQMRPLQHLLQDCLNDNLEWRKDCPSEHPFKVVCDKVSNTIKSADKNLSFNFNEKFSYLTKAPFGLYSNFAAMGMMAFALRPWVNKIFDMQGKPRDANALIDDVVMLFKVWDDGKSDSKLSFKFQTPEEGRLCKELIGLFGLNGATSRYKDVTSLKDARFAITGDFLDKRKAPLWVIKYVPQSSLNKVDTSLHISDEMKTLVDNIVKICSVSDLRNPALVTDTLHLIDMWHIEMRNVLNIPTVFADGLKAYLIQLTLVNIKEDEVDKVIDYITKHLQSSVGLWSEEEVSGKAKDWVLENVRNTEPLAVDRRVNGTNIYTGNQNDVNEEGMNETIASKRSQAKARIAAIDNIDDAKSILNKLCEGNYVWVLDLINE